MRLQKTSLQPIINVGTIVGSNSIPTLFYVLFLHYTNIMKLTVTQIKALKPKDKQYKVSDGKGLNLFIHNNGSKYWRLSYRYEGKQKTLALGVFPVVSLALAREKTLEAKKQLAQGKDPSELKKAMKAPKNTNTFNSIAKEWFKTNSHKWSDKHSHNVWVSLEDNIFNHFGNKPIDKVTPMEIIDTLRLIENRGALEQLKKIRQRCNHIFIYAKVTGLINSNPCEGVETVLKSPTIKNYNSIQLKELPKLVKDIKSFDGEPTTKAGLEIALLTFLRTNEIRYATWDEIDFEKKLWVISAERMKMKRDHIVPMSNRVIEILKELQAITGQYEFIFASTHKPLIQPMSENAMLYALYRLGWHSKMTVHGFRHLASTCLNEMGYGSHLIEKQLSHENKNTIAGTYNKAEYLNERITMMNEWSSFVENSNGQIIPIHSKKLTN